MSSRPSSRHRQSPNRGARSAPIKGDSRPGTLRGEPGTAVAKGGGAGLVAPKGGRLVLGFHACREALRCHPKEIIKVILIDSFERSEDLRDLEKLCRQMRVTTELKPSGFLDKVGNHQGSIVILRSGPEWSLDELPKEGPCLLLALDGLEDPHNVGAIVRTAWLLGVHGIIATQERSSGLSPAAHKVASGGVEHVPFHWVHQMGPIFEDLQKLGFWVYGLSPRGRAGLWSQKFSERAVLVLGSEEKGMRINTERACDELISIPQTTPEASLNVSVSAGLAIGEYRRQVPWPSKPAVR